MNFVSGGHSDRKVVAPGSGYGSSWSSCALSHAANMSHARAFFLCVRKRKLDVHDYTAFAGAYIWAGHPKKKQFFDAGAFYNRCWRCFALYVKVRNNYAFYSGCPCRVGLMQSVNCCLVANFRYLYVL
jgi:hypothetical protein